MTKTSSDAGSRGITAPKNDIFEKINFKLFDQIPGEAQLKKFLVKKLTVLSSDQIKNQEKRHFECKGLTTLHWLEDNLERLLKYD